MDAAVELANVTKRYGRVTALAGVSLRVDRGEMFGVIGPDGAGKTTAIRAMCGLVRVEAGEVRALGRDPVRQHREVVRTIGYLSQRFSLYGDLSIDENIAFFAEIHGVTDFHGRRERLLDITQLAKFRGRLAERLSGGMKQKLALACTLVHEPDLLLLDEPTTGVDPVSRREFWMLLSTFREQGKTIVLTTPYLDEAERCSRVALLHEGRLLAVDDPERLRAALGGRMLEVIARPPRAALERLSGLAGIVGVQAFGDRTHVRVAGAHQESAERQILEALSDAGVDVVSVRPIPASLEDVFIARLTEHA